MMITELDGLMMLLVRMEFRLQTVRAGRHGPTVLAAVREWAGIADVLIMLDEASAIAFRTPTGSDTDAFNPTHVMWSYSSHPLWTLRALLTLPLPTHQDAPTALREARRLGLPEGVGCRTLNNWPQSTFSEAGRS
jgi:hypothetical protein